MAGPPAGWPRAGSAQQARGQSEPLSITLIEAPNIPTIGVGEGTWPTIRATLAAIGLSEEDVLRVRRRLQAGVAVRRLAHRRGGDSYYHPFTSPPDGDAIDLVGAWRDWRRRAVRFYGHPQPAVCQAQLAPRQRSMPPYAGALNYAYHLDAAKLAARLSRHAVEQLGVTHVRDEVVGVDAQIEQ